jgi:5'/3'-nucleotidase
LWEGKDPRGRTYYWLYEQKLDKDIAPDTDYAAIFEEAVSVTPLHLDPTDTKSLKQLAHWGKTIGGALGK